MNDTEKFIVKQSSEIEALRKASFAASGGSAAGVQKKKIAWLIEQGGTLIDDDADESIVKYRSAYSVIDKWGRVVWMTKPPGHVL